MSAGRSRCGAAARCARRSGSAVAPQARPRARAGAEVRCDRAAAQRAGAGRHGRSDPSRALAADGQGLVVIDVKVVRGHDLRQREHGGVDRDRQATVASRSPIRSARSTTASRRCGSSSATCRRRLRAVRGGADFSKGTAARRVVGRGARRALSPARPGRSRAPARRVRAALGPREGRYRAGSLSAPRYAGASEPE